MSLIEPGTTFFLIRHGETEWNREGRLQGQRDIPLSPVGRDQAAAAGRMLRGILRRRRVADLSALRFVASPLSRARDTMELARGAMDLAPEAYDLDDRLKELSFGEWEGMTWAEVKAIAPAAVRDRKRNKWHFIPPEGEGYACLAERVRPWLSTIRPMDVVVAHGGVARVLMHLVAGIPIDAAPDLDIWQGRVMTFSHNSVHWD